MIRVLRFISRFEAGGLIITNRVLRSIPTAKAEINTPNECYCMVNDADFLMVRKEKLILPELIGRPLNKYVGMQIQ